MHNPRFDVVVIDEAAQAVEPSVLVPLVMGCKQVREARMSEGSQEELFLSSFH
jgi:senataxin